MRPRQAVSCAVSLEPAATRTQSAAQAAATGQTHRALVPVPLPSVCLCRVSPRSRAWVLASPAFQPQLEVDQGLGARPPPALQHSSGSNSQRWWLPCAVHDGLGSQRRCLMHTCVWASREWCGASLQADAYTRRQPHPRRQPCPHVPRHRRPPRKRQSCRCHARPRWIFPAHARTS